MSNNIELTDAEKDILDFSNSKLGKIFELAIVPIPGANVVYSSIVGNIEKKNLMQLLQSWTKKELDRFYNEKSVEQIRLIKHAVLVSLRCSHELKIERITDILSDSFKKSVPAQDEAEDLINIVAELSENEAIVFREIYSKLGSKNLDTKDYPNTNLPFGEGDVASHHNIRIIDIQKILPQYSDNLAYYVNRLIGKGLLREADITTRGSGKIYWHTLMGYQLFNTFHGDKQ